MTSPRESGIWSAADGETPPSVSVIMPAFNAEPFIAEAIASVLQQELTDLELVVVDDGSFDNTAAVVSSFDDPRLRLIRSKNHGVSHARNRGIAASSGPWIALLDADDYWARDRLTQLLAIAVAHQADLVADDLVILDGRNPPGTFFEEVGWRPTGPRVISPSAFIGGRIADKGTSRLGIIKPLIRRDFLAHACLAYAEYLHGMEDWLLYCQCLVRGAKLVLSPNRTYFYRRVPDSLSLRDSATMLESQLLAINHLALDPSLPPEFSRVLAELADQTFEELDYCRFEGLLRQHRIGAALHTARSRPGLARLYGRRRMSRLRVKLALRERLSFSSMT